MLGSFALAMRILLIDYNFCDMISFLSPFRFCPGCWLWLFGETDLFMYMNFVFMSVARISLRIS